MRSLARPFCYLAGGLLGLLERLVYRLPGGGLRSLGDLAYLIGDTSEETVALILLVLSLLFLAHVSSPFGKR